MDELENKFYKILEGHNHEIVMDFVWLVNLAHELAAAAQPGVQRTGCEWCAGNDVEGHEITCMRPDRSYPRR